MYRLERSAAGFGDIVTPAAQLMSLPALLSDLPAPQLYAYNRETVIAEKFEAMVLLGIGNTRMKDFYDLWYLSQHFTFEGNLFCSAIAATFERRRTPLPTHTPLALTSEFTNDEVKRGTHSQAVGEIAIPPLAISPQVGFEEDWDILRFEHGG